MRARIAAILTAVLLAAGGVLVLTPSAHAQSTQICDSASECLNAWSGGPYVKTYSPNVSNDNFGEQAVAGRCRAGSALTTAGCPFANVPAGLPIIQVRYDNASNECVGDLNGSSGDAHAAVNTGCNNTVTGSGGGYGTLFIVNTSSSGCPSGNLFVNVHWSSNWNSQVGNLDYNGSGNGQQWWLNTNNRGDCLTQF